MALLTMLGMGIDEVIWIDSDIVIARDFRPFLKRLDLDTLVVSEEALGGGRADPDGLRARLWSLPVGRFLPYATNTGIIRVTAAHKPLLHRWNDLLQSREYREAQDRPWYAREVHVAGDQEVLTALLASEQFMNLPVRFLRRGVDIIQFFGTRGYTVGERLRHLLRPMPYFVHSLGFRPWWPNPAPVGDRSAQLAYLYNALSPYTVLARRYATVLEDQHWLQPPTPLARVLLSTNPALCGLPIAIVVDLLRLKRGVTSLLRAWHPHRKGKPARAKLAVMP